MTSKELVRIEVVRRLKLVYHVNLVREGNNEILLSSETYYNKGNAIRAAEFLHQITGWTLVVKP